MSAFLEMDAEEQYINSHKENVDLYKMVRWLVRRVKELERGVEEIKNEREPKNKRPRKTTRNNASRNKRTSARK